MPTSKKQIKANRKNAQKSTGPKTNNGKQKSSKNSTRHGLYTTDLIINSPALKESPNEYHHLLKSIFEELNPVGIFEEQLVLKIVNCLWRTQRAARAETAEIQKQLERVDSEVDSHFTSKMFFADDDEEIDPEEEKRTTSNYTAASTIPAKSACLNILRYETRLDRQLARYYKILTQSQALRLAREKNLIKNKPIQHIPFIPPNGAGFIPFIPPNGAGLLPIEADTEPSPRLNGADTVGGGFSAPNELPQSDEHSNKPANDLEAFFERESARSPLPLPGQAGFIPPFEPEPIPENDDLYEIDDDEDDIDETTGNAKYIAQAEACRSKSPAVSTKKTGTKKPPKTPNDNNQNIGNAKSRAGGEANPPNTEKRDKNKKNHNNQNVGSEPNSQPKKRTNWQPRRRLHLPPKTDAKPEAKPNN